MYMPMLLTELPSLGAKPKVLVSEWRPPSWQVPPSEPESWPVPSSGKVMSGCGIIILLFCRSVLLYLSQDDPQDSRTRMPSSISFHVYYLYFVMASFTPCHAYCDLIVKQTTKVITIYIIRGIFHQVNIFFMQVMGMLTETVQKASTLQTPSPLTPHPDNRVSTIK